MGGGLASCKIFCSFFGTRASNVREKKGVRVLGGGWRGVAITPRRLNDRILIS
jgi:hypothetical protein